MEKAQNFESFLQEIHAINYTGTDDDMSDAFEVWLEELQTDDLIEYADKFARFRFLAGKDEGLEIAIETIKSK